MNTLMPAEASQPLQRRDVVDVLARAADIEGEVAEHAMARALAPCRPAPRRCGERLGVGHLEHGGDAADHRGAAAGLQVLLLLQARLAEMHLGVDDAGQHVQARWRRRPRPPGRAQAADGGDAAIADADIALGRAVVIDDGAALDQDIEGLGHAGLLLASAACALTC